jgi:uncharacterized protein (TIGR02588 family)
VKRNVVEWLVLGISVLAIIVLAGVLLIEGIGPTREPNPMVTLRTAEARPGHMGWIVPATVANDGDLAAEAVLIEATAAIAGEPETSEVEINFLPAGTEVKVAFAFSAKPEGEIATRLVSFRVP